MLCAGLVCVYETVDKPCNQSVCACDNRNESLIEAERRAADNLSAVKIRANELAAKISTLTEERGERAAARRVTSSARFSSSSDSRSIGLTTTSVEVASRAVVIDIASRAAPAPRERASDTTRRRTTLFGLPSMDIGNGCPTATTRC